MTETRVLNRHLRQESEANTFAIELLAPMYKVQKYTTGEPNLKEAQDLRSSLDISLEATIRRWIDKHSEPLAAVWSLAGQVRYFVKGNEFPFVNLRRGERLPPESLAAKFCSNEVAGISRMREIHPQIWTGRSDLELFEQTRLSNNGYAVTLLWADLPQASDDDNIEELWQPRFR